MAPSAAGEHREADILVVGGGAAGCVVAARLAASSARVMLLEAGPDLRRSTATDLRDGWRLPTTSDWGLESEPDELGRTELLRRVKGVGGTGWMTRFALRGSPADFHAWAAAGNPGWAFDDLLPAFQRLETDLDFGDRPWHGTDGPIPITRYPDHAPTEIHAAAIAWARDLGLASVDDHNEPGALGVGRMPMSSRGGARVTTADAYLPIHSTPPNLEVRADAEVATIMLDGNRAVGARLVDGTIVRAGLVVLAAGTYGSPTILLRSGIGPAPHLRDVGVPVVMDLPGVGSNLADHPGVDLDAGWQGNVRSEPILHSIVTLRGSGWSEGMAPQLMLWFVDPRGDPAGFEVDVLLMKPRSRGTVRLRSADPGDLPRIELPGVRDPHDIDCLAEGYRVAWELLNTAPVRRLCQRPSAPLPPTDVELRQLVAANAYSIPHVVGTCAMGPAPDAGAVVDATGRVHGIEALSIADASVIPDSPSGSRTS